MGGEGDSLRCKDKKEAKERGERQPLLSEFPPPCQSCKKAAKPIILSSSSFSRAAEAAFGLPRV